jgi:methylenetetrahydrofolate reductase (NADPH)
VTALAHMTCVSTQRAEILKTLEKLREYGVENILAIRGDMPENLENLRMDYEHASDLIGEIRRFGGFSVGGACYPEGHPESEGKRADLDGIRRKVDAGCEFLTTQMFFDNNILYNFLFRLLKHGIQVPVIAGIMPVTREKQVRRIFQLSGTTVPPRFRAIVDRFSDNPAAMKQAGIAYATEQIIDLIANGVSHVHIYTMNQPDIAGSIISNLSEIFR